jgi:hypothetical protein
LRPDVRHDLEGRHYAWNANIRAYFQRRNPVRLRHARLHNHERCRFGHTTVAELAARVQNLGVRGDGFQQNYLGNMATARLVCVLQAGALVNKERVFFEAARDLSQAPLFLDNQGNVHA